MDGGPGFIGPNIKDGSNITQKRRQKEHIKFK